MTEAEREPEETRSENTEHDEADVESPEGTDVVENRPGGGATAAAAARGSGPQARGGDAGEANLGAIGDNHMPEEMRSAARAEGEKRANAEIADARDDGHEGRGGRGTGATPAQGL